jgi:hypothetical protein
MSMSFEPSLWIPTAKCIFYIRFQPFFGIVLFPWRTSDEVCCTTETMSTGLLSQNVLANAGFFHKEKLGEAAPAVIRLVYSLL